MYDTKFICTYQNHFNDENIDNNLSNQLYQEDFLKVFGIEDYSDEIINVTINKLHTKLSKIENMNCILKKLAKKFMSEDTEIGLMVGFSYDYFYLLHPCICDLLEKDEITDSNYNLLKNLI
uniref:Uncharacterized protein n=1 Tax=viral metagenome TaxID=1070528 RepID=A0A6C0KYQ4_9ZZZZ